MVCTESFEFPLLPGNHLLNILATWKVMDCIHGNYIKNMDLIMEFLKSIDSERDGCTTKVIKK